MKRDRQIEGEKMLRDAESNLRKELLDVLPEIMESGTSFFFNSHFNPFQLPAHHLSKLSEAMIESSLACVEMREALGLPVEGSPGRLFIEACEESASSDDHRRGPRKLAAALLARLHHGA